MFDVHFLELVMNDDELAASLNRVKGRSNIRLMIETLEDLRDSQDEFKLFSIGMAISAIEEMLISHSHATGIELEMIINHFCAALLSATTGIALPREVFEQANEQIREALPVHD